MDKVSLRLLLQLLEEDLKNNPHVEGRAPEPHQGMRYRLGLERGYGQGLKQFKARIEKALEN